MHKRITKRVKFFSILAITGVLTAGFSLHNFASASVPGTNSLVSVSSSSAQGNTDSILPTGQGLQQISGNGHYIAFYSMASNLVSGDTNSVGDDFVRDTVTGATTRVSVSSSGAQANGNSTNVSISYDGRYVAFTSEATNLVASDTNASPDVFLHDMQTGTTIIVSTTVSGTQGNKFNQLQAVSGDGRYVVIQSNSTNLASAAAFTLYFQLYLKDMVSGSIKLLSHDSSGNIANANANSGSASISCDGSVVAFDSAATNLVSGDTNGKFDIFLYVSRWSGDNLTDVTISGNGHSSLPAVSCNGNTISYQTDASNLVAGMTTTKTDVLEYSRLTQANVLVSQSGSGSEANSGSNYSSISDDGRYVTFTTSSTNLDPKDTTARAGDIFVRDVKGGTIQLVSLTTAGTTNAGGCSNSSLSADGSYVAYNSTATSLVNGDTNGFKDVFSSLTGF